MLEAQRRPVYWKEHQRNVAIRVPGRLSDLQTRFVPGPHAEDWIIIFLNVLLRVES